MFLNLKSNFDKDIYIEKYLTLFKWIFIVFLFFYTFSIINTISKKKKKKTLVPIKWL